MNDDMITEEWNDGMITEEWLQMNFPVGTGPKVTENDCLDPSDRHYLTIQFGKNEDWAHFIINETAENEYGVKGLRSHNDRAVFSFSMPRELLLKIVRTIKASNDVIENDDIIW